MSKEMNKLENANLKNNEENSYVARNRFVAAKERLYDRMKLSVRQVDYFIAGCILLIVSIIVISVVL
jgi:hypothetical protein